MIEFNQQLKIKINNIVSILKISKHLFEWGEGIGDIYKWNIPDGIICLK